MEIQKIERENYLHFKTKKKGKKEKEYEITNEGSIV